MFIKQITMFIENRPGRISEFTTLLAENDIDLVAISVADTTNFGILRAIVNDYEKAASLLLKSGYTVNVTDVLSVAVPDTPGGLSGVMKLLKENDVSIEYLYSLVNRIEDQAIIILRVNNPQNAEIVFEKAGVRMLSHDDIRNAK